MERERIAEIAARLSPATKADILRGERSFSLGTAFALSLHQLGDLDSLSADGLAVRQYLQEMENE